MSSLELSFLGPVQYRRGGSYLALNSAKAVALLGYLANVRKAQRREHLMALLWPDSLPQAARKNLRNTLWTIRKTLGEEAIVADAEEVALGSNIWVDIHVFLDPTLLSPPPDLSEIEAAASLFQGPFLEGLSLSEAPDFEIWLIAERERLGRHYLKLLDLLIAGYRSRANWPKVIEAARQALAWDNLQESVHVTLIESFGRMGERSRAVRQYESLIRLLQSELGIEPLAETRARYEEVLSGDLSPVSLRLSEEESQPVRPRRQRPATQSPFVGRTEELGILIQEWNQVLEGNLRVVLLAGELGIGKSRLWEEWRNTLPANTTVLETYCLDTNQAHPFGPVLRLLRNDPCASQLLGSSSPITPIWLAELSRLLPEIRDFNPDLPEPMGLQPAEERSRLLEALTKMILYFGEGPFTLFLDDLHWVDPATLDWLVYLADRLREIPLLLALAFRPAELPAAAAQVLAGWHRQRIARRIELRPFTPSETTELLAKLGNDRIDAPELYTCSAGNPYFLVELSRAGPGTIPPSLVDLIHTRLQALPESARQLLQAASVLKGEFEMAVLVRMAGQREEQTLDILDILLEAEVFAEHGGEYSFRHSMVETLIYEELSVARRRYLHGRAADALETVHAGRLAPIASDLAYHYANKGNPNKAAFYADMAAGWALGMSAPEDAAVLYRQAYLWEPTLERMTDLGQALVAAGDMQEAQKAFREALEASEREGDRTGIARAQLALAGSYMLSGEREQVVYWANQAMTSAVGILEPEMEAQAHLMLGMGGASVISRLSESEQHLARAGELAEANGLVQLTLQSQFERANLLAQRGDLVEAVALFALTAEQARAEANPVQEMLALNNLAYHEHLLGELAAARGHIETALAMSENYSLVPFDQFLFSTRGEVALAEGDYDEAERWFDRAMAAAVVANNEIHQANLKANMGLLAQARGDLDMSLLLLQEAHTDLSPNHESFLKIKIGLSLVELHLARGERAAAGEVLAWVNNILANSEYEGYKRQAATIKLP